jgi:hypothetical protein
LQWINLLTPEQQAAAVMAAYPYMLHHPRSKASAWFAFGCAYMLRHFLHGSSPIRFLFISACSLQGTACDKSVCNITQLLQPGIASCSD